MKRLLLGICLLIVASSLPAADWPQWRGPALNGSSPERNLPVRWSRSENIAWSTDLPGEAASTPIVCGDSIFLAGVDAARDALQAQCYDRRFGKLRWSHDVGQGSRRDRRSNFAAPSPVTDGKRAIFFFSTGRLLAYDFNGKLLWERDLVKDYGPFAFQWTFSTSPLLYDGRLYMQVLQRDVPAGEYGLKDRVNESYLLALDPATGKTLWRTLRPSQAVAESREAFSTPVVHEHDGQKQLLVVGGDALSGHDPASGQELWRWGAWNPERIGHWRLVPSPVGGAGVALACAPKQGPIFALRIDRRGPLNDSAIVWSTRENKALTSDVPTPAFADGDFFILSEKKNVSRVEPRSGRVKWTVDTPAKTKYEASPTVADGKVYIINLAGQAAVFDAADGKLLHAVSMDEPQGNEVVRASIIAAGSQLLIRTTRKLYCVGQPVRP